MAQQGRIKRQAAERAGHLAEWIAGSWLRLKGYRLLARRFRCPQGEVDVIAQKGRTLCFVEVKHRPTHEAALEAVTPTGERRIIAAATIWAARHKIGNDLNWRYDIITVAQGRPQHHKDAFRPHHHQPIINPSDLF